MDPTLTISWPDDTTVIAAPGRPGSYVPVLFTATWGDEARITIHINGTSLVLTDMYLRDGLQGQLTRDAWRERIARAIDGACWCIEQLSPAELSERKGHTIAVGGKPARPKVTDEHLRDVARVYEAEGGVAVARQFGLTTTNASQRVYEARRRGLLEPAGA